MGSSSSVEERILENKLVSKTVSLFSLNRLIWLFICIGIFLRFNQYLLNHSLWIDESFVALNILDRSYLELFKPLEYNQGAPIGFLLAVKFATQIFGNSEQSLRLFPFLSGIFSIFLFYKVARWFGTLTTTAIAVGLFALCDRLIYYSAELKQYSSDTFIALLLYFLSIQLSNKTTNIQLIIFAVVGAIAIWFSHPSVFILAGIGLTLLISAWIKKEWSNFSKYIAVSLTWLASFIAFYIVSIQELSNNAALQKSWDSNHNSFMPLPPVSLNDLKWYFEKFFEVFNYPSGLYLTGIAALAFVIGLQSIFSSNKQKFYLLISPLLVTLLASGLHKYPFKGQLLLFIIPSVLLIVASGTQQIIEKTRDNFKTFSIGFVSLLFLHPFYYVALSLNAPQIPPNFEYQRIRED
ncbi:MAG: glycosyltransferase family 39 protein, partial [Cyanobacteria bacterium J06629_18]